MSGGIGHLMKKNKVTVFMGAATLPKAGVVSVKTDKGVEELAAKAIILATGARARELPGLEAFGQGVMQQFERFLSDDTPHGGGHWQQSIELGSRPLGSLVSPSIVIGAMVSVGRILTPTPVMSIERPPLGMGLSSVLAGRCRVPVVGLATFAGSSFFCCSV